MDLVCAGLLWEVHITKHHSIFSFQEMTHDNTELYTKATGNSRSESQKSRPLAPLSVKIPENSRYENTAGLYIPCVSLK